MVEALEVKSSIKIGSPDHRIGITLYDEMTGAPYCLKISSGTPVSTSGECSSSSSATQTTTPATLDTTSPVITLLGNSPAQLNIGDTFIDPGTTVADNADSNLSVTVSGDTVVTTADATYTLRYNATDSAGNHAVEVTRTVVVGTGTTTISVAE